MGGSGCVVFAVLFNAATVPATSGAWFLPNHTPSIPPPPWLLLHSGNPGTRGGIFSHNKMGFTLLNPIYDLNYIRL